ncbi:TonB-dependent receptor plug domain-containing protein [Rhizorhapis suberifaciens]|uniref:Iron complex outermembrane receptor protein n=1 Tax=Rhizorhapis suberifaciens TaxID=13656 RepID=A0A840HWB3_9SPHN|nr:TonB-dependent receptor [Rhizorhapis suberifaciens]MBB4641961.1 iron complex outermembrane receptor protein [Rhizorhapis suberifaciens]
MKKWLLGAAVGALFPANASAQDADGIIVIGEGLPLPPGSPAYGSVTIERERLTNDASNRIEDVLRDVAGFAQFRRSDSRSANPSAQGATLRSLGGNASSRALVLLDGVPQADPFFGYVPFNALVPERLSLIRVTRGGGAGAFGAGAVAGTIEMASAGRDMLPDISAGAFYGSRDSTEVSATVTPDLGAGFMSLSGRWDRGDGFFTTPKDQRNAFTVPAAYDGWSIGMRAVAPISSDIEVQARGLVFRDERTLRFAGADSSSEGQDASVRLVAKGPWQVDALAYLQSRNFSNIVINSSGRKTLDQRNTPSTGVGGKIEVRPPVGQDHVLRIGADLRRADGDMYENAFNAGTGQLTTQRHAGGQSTTLGFFVEDDWTLGNLVLTGGGRVDRWTITNGFFRERDAAGAPVTNARFADRDGWRATGRAGLLFNLTPALALRAAAYTGFRVPTLNELYRPFVVFPVRTQANAELDPERLEGIEAGWDVRPIEGVSMGFTAYYNRLEGAISNVTIGPDLRQRQNVDAIVAKGFELTAQGTFADFLLSASYAYSHSEVKADGVQAALDGMAPAQSPRHMASATFGWAPASGPALSATVRYVGKQYEDDLQTDVLPDAVTVDGMASIPVRHGLRLVGRVENLFDEEVVTRNVGGSMDLGTPRTFWIGLRFEQ